MALMKTKSSARNCLDWCYVPKLPQSEVINYVHSEHFNTCLLSSPINRWHWVNDLLKVPTQHMTRSRLEPIFICALLVTKQELQPVDYHAHTCSSGLRSVAQQRRLAI